MQLTLRNIKVCLFFLSSFIFVANLSPSLSNTIIGHLYEALSEVCIEKLAQCLKSRIIFVQTQLEYFESHHFSTDQKRLEFVKILRSVAERPNSHCVKCVYLSLWDSFEKGADIKTQHHLKVAQYLRKEGIAIFY